ncbi:hypothetical protein ACIQAC_30625 [Streptomyces sp. NPDC088387]|uniref:hypothetical protein n=1 Tax=Streptomyces sp. NPDC088387 TaxID=3365859 RepID=UPI0038033942
MSALFRVRILAVSGTQVWCAAEGRLTAITSGVLRAELTARCGAATVVVLDLRQLRLAVDDYLPRPPWPDGPHTIHLLAPGRLRSHTPDDRRLRWHTDVDAAWRAWSVPSP